jgi:hypothetical protein
MIKVTMVMVAALAALAQGGCSGHHCMTEQECAAEQAAWERLRSGPSYEQKVKDIYRQNNDPYCKQNPGWC